MRRSAILAAGAGLVLAAAGCGGSSEGGGTASGPSLKTVDVSETDYMLDPATVTLDKAGTYTFRAANKGGTEHALEIEGNGIEEETETIATGGSAELSVDLKPGTYELYCPVDGHRDKGMVGKVVVAGGAGGGGTTTGEDDTGGGQPY